MKYTVFSRKTTEYVDTKPIYQLTLCSHPCGDWTKNQTLRIIVDEDSPIEVGDVVTINLEKIVA